MQAWFDSMQEKLADAIDPTTNTVGHFIKQIYATPEGFASGGLADTTENSDATTLRNITNEANAGTTGVDKSLSGRFGDSALGGGFYNSPVYLMQHYTQLGKFFSGTEPGNKYTDHYATPQKQPAPVSEDPENFYARWYNKLRNFAQAEEVSGAGQAEIRSR